MNMKPAEIILTAIVVILSIILGIDLYLLEKGGLDNTISAAIWRLSQDWPIIPFICGTFSGHLFWFRTSNIVTLERYNAAFFIVFGNSKEEEKKRLQQELGL